MKKYPAEARPWLTPDIENWLKTISGSQVTRKRYTLLRLAFAEVNALDTEAVFADEHACTRLVWQKWLQDETIAEVYRAVKDYLLDWQAEQYAAHTPDRADDWLTPELEALLDALAEPHAAKKRYTVMRLAFAEANQESLTDIFKTDENTCTKSVWYEKWAKDPAIQAAYEAIKARIAAWQDQETAEILSYYHMQRKRNLAIGAARAAEALAQIATNQTEEAKARIVAATELLSWDNPDDAQKARGGSGPAVAVSQTVNAFAHLSDEDLDVIIANLEAGQRSETVAPADPPAE